MNPKIETGVKVVVAITLAFMLWALSLGCHDPQEPEVRPAYQISSIEMWRIDDCPSNVTRIEDCDLSRFTGDSVVVDRFDFNIARVGFTGGDYLRVVLRWSSEVCHGQRDTNGKCFVLGFFNISLDDHLWLDLSGLPQNGQYELWVRLESIEGYGFDEESLYFWATGETSVPRASLLQIVP